jgi:hypothetical protein
VVEVSVLQAILQSEDNGEWVDSNFDEIQARFSDRFIAVKEKTIIADAGALDALLEKLTAMGEDLDEILIQFVHGKDFSFIL